MTKLKQIIKAVLLSIGIFAGGTAGYMFIEGWSLIDSAYMTTITLSTVGYGEINEVSSAGRIYTIFLIFAGAGLFLYLAGVIMQLVVEGEIQSMLGRRRLDIRISKMKNHYLVCGYGRIGRILCRLLKEETSDVVVLEQNLNMVPVLDKDKMCYMSGNASDESQLIKAGIHRAGYLVAALGTDTDNVFLVLTARQLNPNIYIMARAGSHDVKSKLIAAGANRVESPYDIGAVSMGLSLLRPSVSNFLEIALSRREKAIQIEETAVSPDSRLINIMLKESGIRQTYNLIIIAIRKADNEMLFNPSFEALIEEGDTVIAMGQARDLKRFHEALNPNKT